MVACPCHEFGSTGGVDRYTVAQGLIAAPSGEHQSHNETLLCLASFLESGALGFLDEVIIFVVAHP